MLFLAENILEPSGPVLPSYYSALVIASIDQFDTPPSDTDVECQEGVRSPGGQ